MASLVLCVIFLFNIMGYYTAFIIQRSQLRNEMKAFIRSDEGIKNTQRLLIPYSEYETSVNFIEEDEFIYKEELYDLISLEKTPAGIVLFCINDEKEELLLAASKEHFSRNHEQNSPNSKSTSVIKNIIKEACPENIFSINNPAISLQLSSSKNSDLFFTFLPTHSPPPKPSL